MEVTTTNKLDLEVLDVPFHLNFAWNKKRGVDGDSWFTPMGNCKVHIGALHNNHVGNITHAEYLTFVKMMRTQKCEVLTNGSAYYTLGDDSIQSLDDFSRKLYIINKEWDKRKYIEGWVEDNRPTRINKWGRLEIIEDELN
jgi:hypothetical protein